MCAKHCADRPEPEVNQDVCLYMIIGLNVDFVLFLFACDWHWSNNMISEGVVTLIVAFALCDMQTLLQGRLSC